MNWVVEKFPTVWNALLPLILGFAFEFIQLKKYYIIIFSFS